MSSVETILPPIKNHAEAAGMMVKRFLCSVNLQSLLAVVYSVQVTYQQTKAREAHQPACFILSQYLYYVLLIYFSPKCWYIYTGAVLCHTSFVLCSPAGKAGLLVLN